MFEIGVHIVPWAVRLLKAAVLLPLVAFADSESLPTSLMVSNTASTKASAIAVADILGRADEDQQRVDWAKRLLLAPDPVEQLSRKLNDIAPPALIQQQAVGNDVLHEFSAMRLESLARHWKFNARLLERWQAQARVAFAPYSNSALVLAQRRAVWAATRTEGLQDNLPSVLLTRIDNVLTEIDAVEPALDNALTRQFELLHRASELNANIQGGENAVAAALDELDRRLLQVDAPPIWKGLELNNGSHSAWTDISDRLDIESQFAVDYNAASTRNQQALKVVQFLLLPLILWLVVRSRHSPTLMAEPRKVSGPLRRPFSAWLLLSVLGVLVLEPDVPLLSQELALLIALVPLLRLLPTATFRVLGIWPYVAVVLYGFDRLGVAIVGDNGIYRLYLLIINGLAFGLTLWLLRRTTNAVPAPQNHLQRAIRPIGWSASILLAVAFVANVFGNVSVAETLTSGVIDSGYMALLLYASVAVCSELFRAVLAQPELAQRYFVRKYQTGLQSGFTRLLVFGASLSWMLYSMDQFRVLRPLHSLAETVLDFGIEVGEVSIDLGDLLVFLLSVWLSLWVARAVRRFLRGELPNHARLPRGVGNSIASLSYYAVLMLGLLLALSAAGFKVSQLALVFGALSVGIGFGLQNVVNNFVSGLVLMFERPIQPGDIVDAAGSSGTVREIGLRATTIRTFDGADVVVPNGLLLSGNLTNWTMFDHSRRIEISVGVAYGSDPAKVMAVLSAAVRGTPGVAELPETTVVMTGYGDSALNFSVRAWTRDISTWVGLRGEILTRMLLALEQEGISIPYHQVDVNLHTATELRSPR